MITFEQVPNLKEMRRLAYKKIFEKLTYPEEKRLEKGVDTWPRKVELSRHERTKIKSVIGLLIDHENGKWRNMKEKLEELGSDYKKVYGLY